MAIAVRRSIGLVFSATMAFLGGCNSDDTSTSTNTATASTAIGTGMISTMRDAPTIGGSPATSVVAGTAYSFSPTATDPEGGKLTYSIRNLPAWAKFDTSSGTLSGVAQQANVGVYANISISASNGSAVAALAAFSVSVTNTPAAASTLSIAGTPAASVSVGAPYSFLPTTAESADTKLTFSIANKPSWATFDSATGALAGTPGSSNVGVTSAVEIQVSDGVRTASLAAFSVTVQSAAAESVTLSWTTPTTNADGTPAMDLSGYRIYYGTDQQSMNKVVTVTGASDTKQVVNGLAAGTWYFAVRSFNTQMVESALSAIVPITL